MPASHAHSSPRRRTTRTQKGMDNAPLTKYSTRNSAICACVASNRSCAKNSISAAGMALAMPLHRNTANSRRKAGSASGCHSRAWGARQAPAANGGRGARHSAHQPATSASVNTASMVPAPHATDSALAVTTPTSPAPSRHATMRLRCAASPPRRTPQAWWVITSKLCARQVNKSPATIHAASAAAPCTRGKNRPAMPTPSSTTKSPAIHSTECTVRWYTRSLNRPSRGSAPASIRRTSISNAPTVASDRPRSLA